MWSVRDALKILAEFELSDQGVIQIHDRFLNKTEALVLIEELKSDNKLAIYIELATFPELEAFIETQDTTFLENQPNFIANASNEQAASVDQVNIALIQLNEITQQNASASEELAATAVVMSEKAGRLSDLMAFFKTKKYD